MVNQHFSSFDGKYRLIVHKTTNQLLPYIHCSKCKKFWQMYKLYEKDDSKLVRSNPKSNIVNHKCSEAKTLASLKLFQKSELSQDLRLNVAEFFAQNIAKFPTISINAGTQLLNEVAGFISDISAKYKKNYKFDISRQNVSKRMHELASTMLQENISNFGKNYSRSSLVIDHWSSHGRNSNKVTN